MDEVEYAGGFIVQLMPDATEEVISQLEKNIAEIPSVTDMLKSGCKPEDMLERVLFGLSPKVLEKNEVTFECDCSKGRMAEALISIGKHSLTELLEEDKGAEVGCQFCNQKYNFAEEELKELIDSI